MTTAGRLRSAKRHAKGKIVATVFPAINTPNFAAPVRPASEAADSRARQIAGRKNPFKNFSPKTQGLHRVMQP